MPIVRPSSLLSLAISMNSENNNESNQKITRQISNSTFYIDSPD